MLYFSEIVGKKVFTEDNIPIGNLEDILFVAENVPLVSKLVINDDKGKEIFVPIEYLKNINHRIFVYKNYITGEIGENELYISKNLLDKQIIDLSGDKIVRVNDVAIQNKPNYYIAGVDIGVLGILRRLKVEDFLVKFYNFFGMKLVSKFLSWAEIQPLELARGHVKLKKREEKMKRVRPEDLAGYLDETNIWNVRKILNILDEKTAAEVISSLNINYQMTIFKHFNLEKSLKILTLIDPDEAVDILLGLTSKRRKEIIDKLPDKKKKEINYLLGLSQTDIGKYITTEYITTDSNTTVKEIINVITKETGEFSSLNYVYIINENKQLIGVVSLHELLLQHPDTPVYRFMVNNVIVAHITTTEEIALRKMLKYKINAIPIIDSEKRLLGVVSLDDVGEIFFKNK